MPETPKLEVWMADSKAGVLHSDQQQWFLSLPKPGIKIGCNFPLTFGLKLPAHFRLLSPSRV